MNILISDCPTTPKMGGFRQFRICNSIDIIQQESGIDSQLRKISFLRKENWLATFQDTTRFSPEVKSDFVGNDSNHTIKLVIEEYSPPFEFKTRWDRFIKGRKLAIEITDYNGDVICLNPYYANYSYIPSSDTSVIPKYEITFQRARFTPNNFVLSFQAIVKTKYFSQTIPLNEVTIQPDSTIDLSLYLFGYSLTLEGEITYTDSNVINLYQDGTVYLWMIHKEDISIYHVTSIYLVLQQNLQQNANYIVGDGETNPDSDFQIGD